MEARMPFSIQQRDGVGRCAVTDGAVKAGASLLVEKAALYWELGSDELLNIIQAYRNMDSAEKLRVDNLTSNIQTPTKELTDLISSWTFALEELARSGALPEGDIAQDFIPILLRAHFNAHAVQSPGGACLFPMGAMLNHSCSPNTFYRSEAHTIHFVASTDMDQGTELSAAYLDAMTMLKPTRFRQASLLLAKGFLCACDRCSQKCFEQTRSVRCRGAECSGLLQPSNRGLSADGSRQLGTWSCSACQMIVPAQEAADIEALEDSLYAAWETLDQQLARGINVRSKEIDQTLEMVCSKLHPTHFIAQLLRVLLIEVGTDGGLPQMQLLAHSVVYAKWLFDNFRTVPSNLLGTMTGALANLFDRKTHMIVAGLDIDIVLAIIKTVLPYARLRYGEDASYTQALAAVVKHYSNCSSLICQNQGKLLRCGRCDSVAYCSRSCQVFHFKSQGHKEACGRIVEARKSLSRLIAMN